MGKVVYWMSVSLDGFVETRDRKIDWTAPDEELHRFFNEDARKMSVFLYGRRTYELMAAFWPTADASPSAPEYIVDFARIWKSKPKVVFSRTPRNVAWNGRVVSDNIVAEITNLKQSVAGAMGLGGAGIAATCMKLGLIDEYRLFVRPIVLGGGTPFFPPMDHPLSLRLVETRAFPGGVMLLRYQRASE
jgi:dihydrofolate reductase